MKEQIVRVKVIDSYQCVKNTTVQGTEQVPILLVGNKCDLAHQRQVRQEEGIALG